jgi:hypothetical protein
LLVLNGTRHYSYDDVYILYVVLLGMVLLMLNWLHHRVKSIILILTKYLRLLDIIQVMVGICSVDALDSTYFLWAHAFA